MELNQAVQQAHHLTRLLQEALEANDQVLWEDLLEQRSQAMADFSRAHREASTDDRDRCQANVLALVEADGRLQERSRQLLATVREQFKRQLGNSEQGNHSIKKTNTQACLDRKA